MAEIIESSTTPDNEGQKDGAEVVVIERGKDAVVSMSNALVRSSQSLRLSEKRLIALASTKIKRVEKGLSARVKVTAIDYAETYGIERSTAYTQLREAADDLFERKFIIKDGPGKRDFTRYHWVGSIKYRESQGYVELSFHDDIFPHLAQLTREFTTYMLKQASALRSIYAWRLLELMMQFKSSGKLIISVDDFSDALDVPQGCRRDFFNLNNRVIKPAMKELQEKDGWLISLEKVKDGKKVARLVFTFEKNPQGNLPL